MAEKTRVVIRRKNNDEAVVNVVCEMSINDCRLELLRNNLIYGIDKLIIYRLELSHEYVTFKTVE